MSMSVDPELRKRLIAGALQSVEVAAKVRGWYERFDDEHRLKTAEFDQTSSELLENSVRTAIGYGFPVEAVAVAASMSVEEIHAVADGPAAA